MADAATLEDVYTSACPVSYTAVLVISSSGRCAATLEDMYTSARPRSYTHLELCVVLCVVISSSVRCAPTLEDMYTTAHPGSGHLSPDQDPGRGRGEVSGCPPRYQLLRSIRTHARARNTTYTQLYGPHRPLVCM